MKICLRELSKIVQYGHTAWALQEFYFTAMIALFKGRAAIGIPQERQRCMAASVTRLGDLLHFGQLFKAFGNI